MRIYQPVPLVKDTVVNLDAMATHHIARVLRANPGDKLCLFNGQGGEYRSTIIEITKKTVVVRIGEFVARNSESPLALSLAQGISRGEKMDYTIQKAVELGVSKIIPLITERCNVKLDAERQLKKQQHWQSIVIHACEQSGRTIIPEVSLPQLLPKWLATSDMDVGLVLSPHVQNKLKETPIPLTAKITLLIGPEGGLSEAEIELAYQHQFIPLNLGPRVLRTETAALVALTALQCYFGDL